MELSTIAAMIGMALAVGTFFIGRMSSSHFAGREKGSLATDVKYIKASIERIEKRFSDDVSRLERRTGEVCIRLTGIGQDTANANKTAKSAHRRLDEHLKEHSRHKL